jgi:hypothetical protein
VDSAERSQKVACAGPHALGGIDMDLSNTIAIIISCPFMFSVIDGHMWAWNLTIPGPFIRIGKRSRLRETHHMLLQRLAIRVLNDAQAHLSTLASDRADDGWSVIVIGAVPTLFVGPTTRRGRRITMFSAFFPRVLKHLVGFSYGIRQPSLGLEALCIVVQALAQMMHCIIGHAQFARQTRGGFTFAHAAQEQNHLRRAQVFVRKQCPAIHRVHRLTLPAAILRHMTTPGLSKDAGLFRTGLTVRTPQALWMKILPQPSLTEFVVTYLKNWKVHTNRVLPCSGVVNPPATSLGMSQAFYQEWGLRAASCRYFTVYGPRGHENHAVIAMIARSFIDQEPFEVWARASRFAIGHTFPTSSREPSWQQKN